VKRAPELAGLSRDHHEALAVALRLRRATGDDAAAVLARLTEYFERIGSDHFDVEEELLLPRLGDDPRGRRMVREHRRLRELTATATLTTDPGDLHTLGTELQQHVRFEEQDLFPHLEQSLNADELAALGRELVAHGHG
jgi:hemerythrin-like domain-containing protein